MFCPLFGLIFNCLHFLLFTYSCVRTTLDAVTLDRHAFRNLFGPPTIPCHSPMAGAFMLLGTWISSLRISPPTYTGDCVQD